MLVMLLQAGIVSVRDYINETDFLNSYIKREALLIARAIGEQSSSGQKGALRLPEQYVGPHADAYSYRVVEADGRVISEHNSKRLAAIAAWNDRPSQRQDFWVRKLEADERMHVAGGLKIRQPSGVVWVEVATFGDPAGTYLSNLVLDVLHDVWAPALPLVLLSLLVVTVSVRHSLRPLVEAASRADEISVLERGERLDVTKLPAEASHFASAINRLLDRVADLVAAQRLFIARAAHELRTPLSIMMLEIAHLKEQDSKRLEADIAAMSEIVERLLSLSRLQTLAAPDMQPVDIATLTREIIARMLAWAQKDGHDIAFSCEFNGVVLGDETSFREAIRNLVENAVRHTPPGTRIIVEITADGAIVVEDSGPGLGSLSPEELQQPFRKGSESSSGAGLGLAIVRQAAELHGGRVEVGSSPLGGARFVVRLPPDRVASDVAPARTGANGGEPATRAKERA
jgi:signal transduction histidine kinase